MLIHSLPRKQYETSLILKEEVGKSRFERRQELKDKRIKVLPYQRKSVHKAGEKVYIDGKVVKNDRYGGKFL